MGINTYIAMNLRLSVSSPVMSKVRNMDDNSPQRDRLRQKFAVLRDASVSAPPKPSPAAVARDRSGLRRRDYKGERRRLNLRLPAAIVDDLDVLCLAARVDKNSFCEDLLRQALDRQLPELRSKFTPEEWAALQRCTGEGK